MCDKFKQHKNIKQQYGWQYGLTPHGSCHGGISDQPRGINKQHENIEWAKYCRGTARNQRNIKQWDTVLYPLNNGINGEIQPIWVCAKKIFEHDKERLQHL